MSEETFTFTVSRVLIELGAGTGEDRAIETAGTLAAAMRAELLGLFVEEESLLDLSGLPFASAFSPGASRPQVLDPDLVRRTFEHRARAGRRALSSYADAARLAWTFDIARGHSATALGARVCGTDLVLFQQHPIGQSSRELMHLARTTAAKAGGVIVVGRGIRRSAGPVVVIDDGDAAGAESVLLAGRIAQAMEAPIQLFILADDEANARRIESRDRALLDAAVPVTGTRTFFSADFSALDGALHDVGPRLVVADLEGRPFGDDEAAARLLRASAAPIVLIRPRKPS